MLHGVLSKMQVKNDTGTLKLPRLMLRLLDSPVGTIYVLKVRKDAQLDIGKRVNINIRQRRVWKKYGIC